MNQFMVEFDLPAFTEKFVSLIPAQRLKIDELLVDGQIASYSLAMDRSKLWVIINANSESEVYDIISEFPLIDFLRPNVQQLMFSNSASKVPMFSLN